MKDKILKFVKWLIRYKEPVFTIPNIEERKYVIVRSERLLFEWDYNYEIERIMADSIAEEIQKQKLISIRSKADSHSGYKVTAEIMVVIPRNSHR